MPLEPGLNELVKSGIIGVFLFLTIIASMTGAILWGPSVKSLLASMADRITDLVAQRNEAMVGWRTQTELTTRLTAALEERNRIDQEWAGRERRRGE